jgi:Reverse transcriptase (RNA-dependent DNA polymerase)
LQEKCREQQKPLFIAFINLTKAFDFVSRDGLFSILPKIGCAPKLLNLIQSFHDNMKGTVQYDGEKSSAFAICTGVKQGCVLAPTLFGIFFSTLLNNAFRESTKGIFLHTQSDGGLFGLSRLRARQHIRTKSVKDLLFSDDPVFVTHTEEELQSLKDRFSKICLDFGIQLVKKRPT